MAEAKDHRRDDVSGTRGPRFLWLVPVLVGAAVRAWSLSGYLAGNPFAARFFSDSHAYLRWALSLAAGEGPAEVFYQAPLYPYLLSLHLRLFGETPALIYAAQHLLGLASIVLVFRIGSRFLPAVAAAAAASLYALLPFPVFFEQKVIPESLAVAVGLAALALALDAEGGKRRAAAAGSVAAVAALARADLLLFGSIFAIYLFRKSRGAVLFYLLPFLLVLAPVFLWNHSIDGSMVPIAANGGEVFYHGNNGNARGAMGVVPEMRADIGSLSGESVRAASRALGRPVSAGEASAYWFRRGFTWITGHRSDWFWLVRQKARLLVSGRFTPLSTFFDFERDRFPGPPRTLVFLHYPLLFFALVALVRKRARRTIPPAVALFLAVRLATPLLFFVCTRYLALLHPVIALLAGAGAARGLERRRALPWIVPLLLVAALVWSDAGRGREHAAPYMQLASIRSDGGGGEEAVALYGEALRIAPYDLVHYQNLARERERLGDLAGAAAVLRRAAEAGIGDGKTLAYEGTLLARAGRYPEAETILREAIRREPRRSRTRFELGLLLEGSGRMEEAREAYEAAARLDRDDPLPRRALDRIGENRAAGG